MNADQSAAQQTQQNNMIINHDQLNIQFGRLWFINYVCLITQEPYFYWDAAAKPTAFSEIYLLSIYWFKEHVNIIIMKLYWYNFVITWYFGAWFLGHHYRKPWEWEQVGFFWIYVIGIEALLLLWGNMIGKKKKK